MRYTNRERQIINKLLEFQGGSISEAQLNGICQDRAEKHFAIGKLRGLNIHIKSAYRTQEFGQRVNEAFRRRKEKEATIQRKREVQMKQLIRTLE